MKQASVLREGITQMSELENGPSEISKLDTIFELTEMNLTIGDFKKSNDYLIYIGNLLNGINLVIQNFIQPYRDRFQILQQSLTWCQTIKIHLQLQESLLFISITPKEFISRLSRDRTIYMVIKLNVF